MAVRTLSQQSPIFKWLRIGTPQQTESCIGENRKIILGTYVL